MPTTNPLMSPDLLSSHLRHLEALFDSALATLTLIRDLEPTSASTCLPYTPHLLALPPRNPDDVWLAEPAAATYAGSLAEPSPPSPPEPNSIKESVEQPAALVKKPSRVILRFDRCPDLPAGLQRRCNRIRLHAVISKALLQFFDESRITLLANLLAGVNWTRNGNLVLHATEMCPAAFLIAQNDIIWSAIRPLFQLPEDFACPTFDTDETWHSVVLHGVPRPLNNIHTYFALDEVKKWIAPAGGIRECTVLCRPEDLGKKDTLALRLSVSSKAEADHLVREGGCLYGVPCRITHYMRKVSRSTIPAPTALPHPAAPDVKSTLTS
ncbi:hypothetical protein MSAN_02448000 [Mycena sanguinolenta]|uniref:Uncharacterized protein n=1 Tax=Mycena sanguinolenta TaxID=230812 RepID=A0A8H7CAN4_9AGAR|nr:hypothetical protein MSAN_02448000 [Mycena sanguinolenta]